MNFIPRKAVEVEDNYFELLLRQSVRTHGHLCPGQVLGVRMSLLGLRTIGIDDPKVKDRNNIIVFVEMDRCATDAIKSVTGCSLGHRTMKFLTIRVTQYHFFSYFPQAFPTVNLFSAQVPNFTWGVIRVTQYHFPDYFHRHFQPFPLRELSEPPEYPVSVLELHCSPVQRSVLDCLCHVGGGYIGCSFQIRNGPGDLDDAFVGADA